MTGGTVEMMMRCTVYQGWEI